MYTKLQLQASKIDKFSLGLPRAPMREGDTPLIPFPRTACRASRCVTVLSSTQHLIYHDHKILMTLSPVINSWIRPCMFGLVYIMLRCFVIKHCLIADRPSCDCERQAARCAMEHLMIGLRNHLRCRRLYK